MKSKRILGVILGGFLIVAVILISLGFEAAPEAQGSTRNVVGMGDLRRYEAQKLLLAIHTQESSNAYLGMGDLRRYEAQKLIAAGQVQGDNRSFAGMGDLHRFETLQEIQK